MARPRCKGGSLAPSAGEVTSVRLVVVVGLWVARGLSAANEVAFPSPETIVLDALLVVGHWWANAPLRAAVGGQFGVRGHWTSLLNVPLVLAGFLLLRDMYRAVS